MPATVSMKRWPWLMWLIVVTWAVAQISRTAVVTDVTSFLPGPANAEQRLMADQLRDGVSTRILIVGLQSVAGAAGAKPSAEQTAALAAASGRLRESLAARRTFAWVSNGDIANHPVDRDRLFAARYLLSSAINVETFSTVALSAAFKRLEEELASVRGLLVRAIAAADPTLETLGLVDRAPGLFGIGNTDGVWFSADGNAALLLMETTARGQDIDGRRAAIEIARLSAEAALADWPATLVKPSVTLAGAGYFSVISHDAIGKDAEQLTLTAIALVALVLWWALRSGRFLGLAVVPVATGALAGFAAVGFAYGSIHGITLAFGVTLIGEAIDYAIYTFVQRNDEGHHAPRFWGQLSLAVLTSLIGFAAMFLSGFQGLQQLALFSIVGLIVAAACTRWLLPALLPRSAPRVLGVGRTWLPTLTNRLRRVRWPLVIATFGIFALLAHKSEHMWRDSLDSLSAASTTDIARDLSYRTDIGVPDLRTMLAVQGATLDQALERTEMATDLLDTLVRDGALRGYASPSALVPSVAVQNRRQAGLPTPQVLRERIRESLAGGNLQASAFEPFIAAVEAARTQPPITPAYYEQTLIGHWLDAQIVQSADGVTVLIPLQGATPELSHKMRIPGVTLMDLEHDAAQMVGNYRQQALRTALIGALGIVLVLALQIRRWRAILSITATLFTTVVVTAGAMLQLTGGLTVFNLVALLLVAGVASNYTLFFSTLSDVPAERDRASRSVLLAGASTFIGFGVLAFSSAPVLCAIGLTVAIGAALGLFASIVFAPR
ncbi:MAG: hypothetical protein ABIU95_14925 [Burkholderiales bacterium]